MPLYNQNYFKIYNDVFGKHSTFHYVEIHDFDYNIAEKYLKWYYGKHHIKRTTSVKFNQNTLILNIYEMIPPSLFFSRSNIYEDNYTPKDVDYSLVAIFDENSFYKLFKHWKNSGYASIKMHNDIINHLEENYIKYINEAIIKEIIE